MVDDRLPEGPGKLEFKPDERRLAKLARFRRVVLLLTIFLLGGVLLLLILIQPKWMMVEVAVKPERLNTGIAGRGGETSASPAFPPATISDAERIKATVISSGGTVDTSAKMAIAMWQRAETLVLDGLLERDGVDEVLEQISVAKIINDSARNLLNQAKVELTRLQSLTNSSAKSVSLRAFLSAARDFLALVEEEATDRQAWLDAYETALRSFASGDKAEYEIKGNVAGGYLRKCEVRRRRLVRAGARLTEAWEALRQRF